MNNEELPNKEELDTTLYHVNQAMNHFSLSLLHLESYAPIHSYLSQAYMALKSMGAELIEFEGEFVNPQEHNLKKEDAY